MSIAADPSVFRTSLLLGACLVNIEAVNMPIFTGITLTILHISRGTRNFFPFWGWTSGHTTIYGVGIFAIFVWESLSDILSILRPTSSNSSATSFTSGGVHLFAKSH